MSSLLDASHSLREGMSRIPILPDISIERLASIEGGAPLNVTQVHSPLHTGTHIDAPRHMDSHAPSIDEVPLERFIGPAVVASVRRGPGELISVADIEDSAPEVRVGDMLFIETGWDQRFETAEHLDHPSLDPDLASWAVERGVSMVGVDMITPDLPVPRRDATFAYDVHRTLLGNGVLIAENLRNLSPAVGRRVFVSAAPVIFAGADAGHARIVIDLEHDALK